MRPPLSGGKAPVIGFHSVMDNPDSVSRVIPPTTTIANTRSATQSSQFAMLAGRSCNDVTAALSDKAMSMRGDMRGCGTAGKCKLALKNCYLNNRNCTNEAEQRKADTSPFRRKHFCHLAKARKFVIGSMVVLLEQ